MFRNIFQEPLSAYRSIVVRHVHTLNDFAKLV